MSSAHGRERRRETEVQEAELAHSRPVRNLDARALGSGYMACSSEGERGSPPGNGSPFACSQSSQNSVSLLTWLISSFRQGIGPGSRRDARHVHYKTRLLFGFLFLRPPPPLAPSRGRARRDTWKHGSNRDPSRPLRACD